MNDNKNFVDFLAKQREAAEQAQSDYIDSLIEEAAGYGEV